MESEARREPDPRAAGLSISPFCVHIQSKKIFFLDGPPMREEDVLDASGHCWCRQTMQAVGPDGEVVDPADCRVGRACFRPVL